MKGLIETSDQGWKELRTESLASSEAKEIQSYLNKSTCIGGYRVNYCLINGKVFEIFTKRTVSMKVVKKLVEAGASEFLNVFAFTSRKFRVGEEIVELQNFRLDFVSDLEILETAREVVIFD